MYTRKIVTFRTKRVPVIRIIKTTTRPKTIRQLTGELARLIEERRRKPR